MMRFVSAALLLLVGGLAGWWLNAVWDAPIVSAERQPLYWVAPMDPSYRRDAPGKSPMGMDLVPVYESSTEAAGVVSISPAVAHNMGVRTAEVTADRLVVPVETIGFVEFDEQALVHVHTRVEGWIEELSVTAEGDPVTAGQMLFRLYSPQLIKAQEEFLLTMGGGNDALRAASRARLRALGLSAQQVDALAARRRAEERVAVQAPSGGYVGALNVREGMYVRPETETMTIGSLDRVWVIAEVFERDAASLEANLRVQMRLDYLPGATWPGTVDYIYPVLDPQTRAVRVRILLPNPDHRLKPGMFGEVTILAATAAASVNVPRAAVIRGKPVDRVVLALGGGQYRSTPVVTGREIGDRVEILDGLEAGQRVVTSAQFLIDSESSQTADLARMAPRDATPATSGEQP